MNTTAQNNSRGFRGEAPLTCIVTPDLKAEESARLLECINRVRSGERVYFVRITYHKVTDAEKRLPPQDYTADPGLRPNAHEGWLVRAPLNKAGRPYLHLYDEARCPPGEDQGFGHTNICPEGIESFKVLGDRPGPLAQQQAEAQAQQAQASVPNLLAMQAQGMFMMGQAMFQMAAAMMAQAQPGYMQYMQQAVQPQAPTQAPPTAPQSVP